MHTSVAEPFFGSCSCCIEGHGSKEERREEEEARGRSGPYFVAIYLTHTPVKCCGEGGGGRGENGKK